MRKFKKIEFNSRRSEAVRVLQKYPDRCPIIVDRLDGSSAPILKKNKYLVPRDLTVGQLIYMIRKYLKVKPEQAIFLFVKETIPPTSSLVGDVFEKKRMLMASFMLYTLWKTHSANPRLFVVLSFV